MINNQAPDLGQTHTERGDVEINIYLLARL